MGVPCEREKCHPQACDDEVVDELEGVDPVEMQNNLAARTEGTEAAERQREAIRKAIASAWARASTIARCTHGSIARSRSDARA